MDLERKTKLSIETIRRREAIKQKKYRIKSQNKTQYEILTCRGHKRNRLEQIQNILLLCSIQPQLKYNIYIIVKIDRFILDKILLELEKLDLIVKLPDCISTTKGQKFGFGFKTTNKGKEFLDTYKKLIDFLKHKKPDP